MSRLIFSVLILFATGCAEVKPWQRGNLARPSMAFDPDPLESKMQQHLYQSKEGGFGGYGIGGGGCGCS
ncbi:MAG: DUF4266 domain-containing protein [Oligoflexia bacterium]|nr:DUF4266 domain-containing protein [Oligoflexia bacterium]